MTATASGPRARLVLRSTLLFAIGCGGGGDGCGGEEAGEITLDGLGPAVLRAQCEQIFGCCSEAQIRAEWAPLIEFMDLVGLDIEAPANRAECEEALGRWSEQATISRLEGSIAEGRTLFDPEGASAFVRKIEDLGCDEIPEDAFRGPDGLPFLEGTVSDGGECERYSDWECSNGTCECADETCSRTECRERPGLEQPCHSQCAEGLYCERDGLTGSAACVESLDDGGACWADNQCRNRFCDRADGSSTGVCATPALCEMILTDWCGPC
jgi:hypothetical protein